MRRRNVLAGLVDAVHDLHQGVHLFRRTAGILQNGLRMLGEIGNGCGDMLKGLSGGCHDVLAAFHIFRALLHAFDRILGVLLDGMDEFRDLLRRDAGALRQLSDFLRDDREPTSGLPCTGSLDGGVQGQEIGLLGNA